MLYSLKDDAASTDCFNIKIMMENIEKQKYEGTFTVDPDREVHGELTLNGPRSSLHLWDREFFHSYGIQNQIIKGVLNDLTKISLIDCITTEGVGSRNKGNEKIHYAKLFPHYVLFGDQHISPHDRSIIEVNFVIDDATVLFNDYDIFGAIFDATPLIEQVVQYHADDLTRLNIPHKIVDIGPHPQIFYYTGKVEIFSTDTVLGRISAFHNPKYMFNRSSDGIEVKNTIFLKLRFCNTVTFMDAIYKTSRVLNFLELIVGCPQNIELWISKKGEEERSVNLRVYDSMSPKYERSENENRVHPADVLIDAVRNPIDFSRVLADWLTRDDIWHDSRSRFFANFSKQRSYDGDRLIAAANMFDILPDSAVPTEVELPENLKCALDSCRKIFKNLPSSPERDSALNALGRIGAVTLRRKIRHRAQLLIDTVGDRLPELLKATDEAVNCRNHYVHGSPSRIDYSKEPHISTFLTMTLEFVFAASDLIDAGWDIRDWCAGSRRISHPFGQYLETYKRDISKLISLLQSPK